MTGSHEELKRKCNQHTCCESNGCKNNNGEGGSDDRMLFGDSDKSWDYSSNTFTFSHPAEMVSCSNVSLFTVNITLCNTKMV